MFLLTRGCLFHTAGLAPLFSIAGKTNGLSRASSRNVPDRERTRAMLRLSLVRGLGIRTINSLLCRFRDPRSVLDLGSEELQAQGVLPDVAEDLLSQRSSERAAEEWERSEGLGIRIVDILDAEYPSLLREIFDPPVILYIKGLGWDSSRPQIAIVGTRRPTGYGLNCAERFAEDLAGRGLAVTSGLARGIDAAAHRGALRSGVTYAVFGSGLDFIYPRENRKLAEKTEEHGAIVSEFPLGTPPSPQNFPIRNRIIAGMALGVLVVEAAEYSGSLITARLALDSNREVFAVPGNVTSPNSFGPHILIRQGAKLATDWKDIAEELPYPVRERILLPLLEGEVSAEDPNLDGVESEIWKILSAHDAVAIDVLLGRFACAPSDIYSALMNLETQNLVRQLPGNKYVRRL